MDSFEEMIGAVQSGLNVSANSSLFPVPTIKSAINRAYIKGGRLFRWPHNEDAQMTSTQLNQEYYDLPEVFSPDSIYRLEIDDELYGEDPDGSPMDFNDYLLWKANHENSTEKKWAVHGNQIFVHPTPTAVGANNISVWGQKNVVELVADAAETIFSKNMPECNEAIVLEAVAILKKKGEAEGSGQMLSNEAKEILLIAYNKIRQEKAKYEKTQPMFEVDDMFGPGTKKQVTGNFS